MNKKVYMRNIFVVNTPFQLYVVKCIIDQHLGEDKNIILSTIRDRECDDVYNIPHGIKGVLRGWGFLKKVKRHIEESAFFIPHLGNLFSSYFFDLSVRYNRPISVYYEGIALFYDPVVINKKAKKKRLLQGLLMGIHYNHYDQLYPKELLDHVCCCYSPVETNLLNKYKAVKKVDFIQRGNVCDNSNVLLLTSDSATDDVIKGCVLEVERYLDNSNQIVYVKPHYALNDYLVEKFANSFKAIDNINVVLLDKHKPIESFFDTISFKHVVCQQFTSSIVNMNFIYGKALVCKVIDRKSIPIDIIKELNIFIQ